MTTRYVPEQYPDLVTALMACSSGDEIVLDTSAAMPLAGFSSALDNITIRAAAGKSPCLDHSLASVYGLRITGDGWTLRGLRFRSTRPGLGAQAIHAACEEFTVEDCSFWGSPIALGGAWSGSVRRSEFRHISAHVAHTTEACTFEACTFIRCETTVALLSLVEGTVDNSTFVRCRATNENVVVADRIRNCTAQLCTTDVSAYIFGGLTACSSNNAWQCDGGLFFGAGGDNTELDPKHVNLSTDLRLRYDSELVGEGGDSDATLDKNGEAFLSPISVGAHESLRLPVAQAFSVTEVRAQVAGGVSAEAIIADYEWTLETEHGVRCAIRLTEEHVLEGGGEVSGQPVALAIHPSLSPGEAYTLIARSGGYGEARFAFTAAEELESPTAVGIYRYAAAIMNGIGRQVQSLVGVAEAALVADFELGARTAFVDTTLNWPEAGAFRMAGLKFAYSSKTDGALHGVATAATRLTIIAAGTRATCDERAYIPAA